MILLYKRKLWGDFSKPWESSKAWYREADWTTLLDPSPPQPNYRCLHQLWSDRNQKPQLSLPFLWSKLVFRCKISHLPAIPLALGVKSASVVIMFFTLLLKQLLNYWRWYFYRAFTESTYVLCKLGTTAECLCLIKAFLCIFFHYFTSDIFFVKWCNYVINDDILC